MGPWTEGLMQEVTVSVIYATVFFQTHYNQHFMNFTLSFKRCRPLVRPTCQHDGEVYGRCWKSFQEAWGSKTA